MQILTKSQVKKVKKAIENLIKSVKGKINEHYIYDLKITGSGKYFLVVADENSHFDLDYQMYLTKNSKDKMDPTRIKNKLLSIIQKNIDEHAENSTTAITLQPRKIRIDNHEFFVSVDLVIMREEGDRKQIIKRNINNKNTNAYTWNEWTAKYDNFDKIIKKMDEKTKKNVFERIKKKKSEEKKHLSTPPKSGTEIFSEIVGEYR